MTHLPVHPTLRHPLTGVPLRALGRFRGRWIWPVMGGDDSVEPADSGTEGEDADLDQGDLDWGLGDATGEHATEDGQQADDGFDAKRAMALITKLRGEVAQTKKTAKADRTAAQEAATKAAQDAQAEMAQKLGLALGLIKPDDPAAKTADADALLKSIQAQVADQAAANNALRQEIALRDAAQQHGADLDALLDSNKFLGGLKGLDATASGYGGRIAKAVAEAIEANPRLKAAGATPGPKDDKGPADLPAAGRSGADITGPPAKPPTRATGLASAVTAALSGKRP